MAEVERLLKAAAEADAAEDWRYGKGVRGDELPAELARRESRLQDSRGESLPGSRGEGAGKGGGGRS